MPICLETSSILGYLRVEQYLKELKLGTADAQRLTLSESRAAHNRGRVASCALISPAQLLCRVF